MECIPVNSFLSVLFCICMFGKLFASEISSSSVNNFQNSIRSIRDDVMGASKFQNHINNVVNLERIPLDGNKIVLEVAKGLSRTFKDRQVVLKKLCDAVTKSLADNKLKDVRKCCNMSGGINSYDSRFHTIVSIA